MREHHDSVTPKMTIDFVFQGLVLKLRTNCKSNHEKPEGRGLRHAKAACLEDGVMTTVNIAHNTKAVHLFSW